jgi:hypothetical protein
MSRSARLTVVGVVVVVAIASVVWFVVARDRHSVAGTRPTASAPRGSSVTFAVTQETQNAPADTLTTFATPLGPVYDVTPSGPVTGATVSFPTTASDLTAINGYQPTTTNLFIAIYEPNLHLWVPLATEYHAGTKTLTAVPPHFSRLRKYVTNGVKKVGSALADVGSAVVKDARTGVSYVADGFVTGVDEFKQLIVDSAQQFWQGHPTRPSFRAVSTPPAATSCWRWRTTGCCPSGSRHRAGHTRGCLTRVTTSSPT